MLKKLLLAIVLFFTIFSCSVEDLEEVGIGDSDTVVPLEPNEGVEVVLEEVLLEELSYNWISNVQHSNGLLESSENTDFVSLYDNALAALVFIQKGELEKAEKILAFFDTRVSGELMADSGGFYQFRNKEGTNGRRKWLGDNAWLLIAVNNYHEASGNPKYHRLAQELELWIRSLQDEDGGLWGGTEEDGTPIHKVTEGIATAFNAVPGYDDFHKKILEYLEQYRWDPNKKTLIAWPENPQYLNALDLHAIGQGVFQNFPKEQLYYADELFITSQMATVSGKEVTGYCFDVDKDVIWLEGTAQMALAFKQLDDIPKTEKLLTELEKTFIASTTMKDSEGIPYTSNHGSTYGPNPLWDRADITPALSSTAWYLLAKTGFDPFAIGYEKNIPTSDMFWIQE
ncbi:hypothetical protein FK220_003950 [Flavobacteriaceae bacterium TP-CH-4]|uniref:Uncharacterized protein n=1 Tax=Pelagihabitans pacificus TaxID=2696054 RepID=A0A967AQB8_9FLAO|nr:hypothetical protein [Pelagihabitans pacificus]NHF58476.1 hypothetical protein [Pelagihabitans pacificus]